MAHKNPLTLADCLENRGLLASLRIESLCCLCGQPLTIADRQTGTRQTDKGEAHASCCFEKLGGIVEHYPIG